MSTSTLRGFLSIIVLKALSEGPKSGYSLMKYVKERIGVKPSPGSMYPLLTQLKKQELTVIKGKGKTKEYDLTAKGKEHVQIIEKKRDECLTNFLEGMKMLSALTGEDMEFPMAMVESMKRGVLPFKEINPEWCAVRNELFSMMRENKLAKKAKRIKDILRTTHKELKAL